jgi:plasmid stabilization system protein ParE
MTLITHEANNQYLDLVDYYLSKGRDRAAVLLDQALDEARDIIGQNPTKGRQYPSVYDKLVWPRVLWIKVHRYWFSFIVIQDEPLIFNIMWDASDIERQANPPPDETIDLNSLR